MNGFMDLDGSRMGCVEGTEVFVQRDLFSLVNSWHCEVSFISDVKNMILSFIPL
jgi:hypothetical protein